MCPYEQLTLPRMADQASSAGMAVSLTTAGWPGPAGALPRAPWAEMEHFARPRWGAALPAMIVVGFLAGHARQKVTRARGRPARWRGPRRMRRSERGVWSPPVRL